VRLAAEGLGLPLVVVRTNLRETAFADADWTRLSHGSLLASSALALEGRYGVLHVAGSVFRGYPVPWGSRFDTDPLHSTASLRFLAGVDEDLRLAKVERVARSPVARAALRVCWSSADGRNCGRCTKCRATMLALEVVGALEGSAAFGGAPLDVRLLDGVFLDSLWAYREHFAARERARQDGRPDLARAIDRMLVRSLRREAWRRALKRAGRAAPARWLLEPLRPLLLSGRVPALRAPGDWVEQQRFAPPQA
jgi:hypothetical protein